MVTDRHSSLVIFDLESIDRSVLLPDIISECVLTYVFVYIDLNKPYAYDKSSPKSYLDINPSYSYCVVLFNRIIVG